MNKKEFSSLLGALELSQMDAARLFHVNPRSVRRWVAGEAPVPTPVAILLRLWAGGKIGLSDVSKAAM